MRPFSGSFSCYISFVFCRGPCNITIWVSAKRKMAVATFFAFLTTAHDRVPKMVTAEDYPCLITQPSGVLVPVPVEVRKDVEEIGVFLLPAESDYDIVF